MTVERPDPLFEHLRGLHELEPDGKRAERTRRRCRLAMQARQVKPKTPEQPEPFGLTVGSRVAYGVSAVYLLGIFVEMLRVYVRR